MEGRGDPRAATKAGCAVEGGGAVESGGGDPRPAATQIEAGGGDQRKDLGGDPTPGVWIRVTEGNGRRLTDGRRGECAKNARTVGEVAGGHMQKFPRSLHCPRMEIQWLLLEFPKFPPRLWFP